MISKKRAFIYSIVIVVVTVICTNLFQLTIGNKVIISKNLYETYSKYNKLVGLEQIINEGYYKDVSEKNLTDSAIKGLFEGLDDPYSEYYTKEEFDALKEDTSGYFIGIGIYLGLDKNTNEKTVISPIKNSAADKAGIKAGDIIVKVDGEDVRSEDLSAVVKKIRGEENKEVNLTIERNNKQYSYNIVRENVHIESVASKVIDKNIGYIDIASFNEDTDKEFEEHLSSLQSKNIKGLIIDLRDNPGGILDVCVNIADDLIGKGTIVYTKDNKGNTEYYKSDKKELDMPIAVLINDGSASASEILTAALVDNNKAIAIGETSFGKGLVQTVKGFKDGTGYKMTTAQYYTPNGNYINKKGIEPKIKEKDKNKQLELAIDYIQNKIK